MKLNQSLQGKQATGMMACKHFLQTHRGIFLLVVFLGYVFLQCLVHWSLVLGENLMKWDIWDAYYPAGVLMSDVLKSGSLPLWNPLMLFGVPYYTIVGMPIWYPTTLLFGLIGYSPLMVNLEYVLHTIIAGFGAFLFIEYSIHKKKEHINVRTAVAFLAGLLYANCCLFLCNAQHIMIVISAAWIPYVLIFYQKYLRTYRTKYLMATAAFAALIFYGGYPELFYCLFVFLIPYTLYFNRERKNTTLGYVIASALRFIRCALLTMIASAMLLLPFVVSMPYLARAGVGGVPPLGMNPVSIFTAVIPTLSSLVPGDQSLGGYYIGLFCIVVCPLVLKSELREKYFYLISALAFFVLGMGDGAFFHSLIYRFMPMYSTFHYPTITRCFIALFVLLIAADIWSAVLENYVKSQEYSELLYCWIKRILVVCGTVFGGICGVLYLFRDLIQKPSVLSALESAQNALFYALCGYGIYLLLLLWFKKKQQARAVAVMALTGAVFFEVFTFAYLYTPMTIGAYAPTAVLQDQGKAKQIEKEYQVLKERKTEISFVNAVRTYQRFDSKEIVFEKTLDERGYLSFILTSTQNYMESYNNMITDGNPVAYFTSNVVNETITDLETWLQNPTVTPDQIYVEGGKLPEKTTVQEISTPKYVESDPAELEKREEGYFVQHSALPVNWGENFYKVRIYLDKTNAETTNVFALFNPQMDDLYISGAFSIQKENGKQYVELYYPKSGVEYRNFELEIPGQEIEKVEIRKMERTTESKYVTIDSFGMNGLQVTVDAPESGYLTLLQTYYPGWSVTVDGEKGQIETVDGTFMGVYLEEGQHHLVFKFRPIDFAIGAGVTAVFIVLFGVVLVRDHKKRSIDK